MSDKEPPVRVVARVTAFENKVWRVRRDHLRDEAGNEVRDYVTLAPKASPDANEGQPAPTQGVAVLAQTKDGRVALLRNWRHPIGRWGWELPKGFVDAGEDPPAAARRELAEETGLASPYPLVPLGLVAAEPSSIAGFAALFLARDCVPTGVAPDAELGMGRMSLLDADEIVALEQAGEIFDALSLVGLARGRNLSKFQP
jgi:ADP-ribose pyrophosphatase